MEMTTVSEVYLSVIEEVYEASKHFVQVNTDSFPEHIKEAALARLKFEVESSIEVINYYDDCEDESCPDFDDEEEDDEE